MSGRQEKVCPGCVSEVVRCRKFIVIITWLGNWLVGVGVQHHGVTLI